MLSLSKPAALAVLASFAAAQNSMYAGHYFIQDTGAPLVVERLDPVLFPGAVGSHVHSIVGANTFGPTVTYESLQEATCSTVYIKADKSVYWLPELYFQHPQNKSFIQVPERPEHKIYYYNRAMDNETIQEFPQDFRMLAGNNELHSMPAAAQGQGITQWYCHGPPDSVATGFPTGFTSCDYGFAGSVHFPHCWNGEAFDISNPSAHMSYPMGDHPDSGYCPDTHPHVMPHIFIEFWFDISMFDGMYSASDTPWVLAPGDPTGYGFHADFINGWEVGVLGNAMLNCDIGESGAPLSDCFDVYTDDERNACSIPAVVDEVITGWMDQLPGCNPIQAGPANAVAQTCNGSTPAISSSTGVPAGTSSGTTSSGSSSSGGSSSGSSSGTGSSSGSSGSSAGGVSAAHATGSGSGSDYSGSGSGTSSSSGTSTTNVAPVDTSSSSGSSYTDPSSSDSSSSSSSPAAASSATSAPGGTYSSLPSTGATLPPNATVTLPSNWTYAGCYTDSVNPRSLGTTGVLFAGIGQGMVTSSACVAYCADAGYSIAGTEFASQCFCDNVLTGSSIASESVCNMSCQGNASEICGGVAALSVYMTSGTKLAGTKRTVGRLLM